MNMLRTWLWQINPVGCFSHYRIILTLNKLKSIKHFQSKKSQCVKDWETTRISLCVGSANEKRRYNVTSHLSLAKPIPRLIPELVQWVPSFCPTGYHEWLLSDDVDILPRLVLPLAGPEEFDDDDNERLPPDLQYLEPDKKREEDPDIRKMLIESVTQVCSEKIA